jgi:hypothetical protein
MLDRTVAHFIDHAIPAAHDYWDAEIALSAAMDRGDPDEIERAKKTAVRMAANAAIAVDGLTDRALGELNQNKTQIRAAVTLLCNYPDGGSRTGALARVRGVANAYKHANLNDATLPITTDNDILTVGLGYGLDGWGIGKMGGVEVIVQETDGTRYKFLGDVPTVLRGWADYLKANGATLPTVPINFGPNEIHR